MSRAEQAGNQAAAWIIAQEDGPWDDEQQAALDAWLAESDGNRIAWLRLRHSWREADRIGALGSGANDTATPSTYAPRRRWWLPPAIAASIAAIIGLGYVARPPAPPENPAIATRAFDTQVGGRKIVGLEDGSKVTLNTASKVRANVTGEGREIWLDQGEAFFDVRHIDGDPFVVHAGSRRITVLGTKFSVRRDGDKVTVTVLEGRVRVDEMDGNRELRSSIISGGDIAMSRGDATLVTAKSEERVENALAWRSGMLSFDQASLGEIAAEFNRYNVKPMVVADPQTAAIRIGGMFPASDPQAFTRLLRDAYGLKVEESASEIRISN